MISFLIQEVVWLIVCFRRDLGRGTKEIIKPSAYYGASLRKRGEIWKSYVHAEEFSITELFHTQYNVLCVLTEFWSEDCLVLGLRFYIRNLFTRQHLAPIVKLPLNSLFNNRKMCYPSPAKNPPL